MKISRVGGDIQIGGDVVVVGFFGGTGQVDIAEQLRLFDCLARPGAGVNISGGLVFGQEVHRHQRELRRGAALHEQHLMGVGDLQDLGQQRDRFVVHDLVDLAAVAVLEDRHARALEVQQLPLGSLEHGQGQGRRARIKIYDPAHDVPPLTNSLMI